MAILMILILEEHAQARAEEGSTMDEEVKLVLRTRVTQYMV